jgi:WD40 repeat protein
MPFYLSAQNEQKPIMIIKKHKAAVQSLAFSPDSKYLASGSEDKTAVIWDLQTFEPFKTFPDHFSTVKVVIFTPDQQYIITSGDNTFKRWSLNGGTNSVYTGNPTYLWSLSVTKDSKFITGGSFDKIVKIWELEKGAKSIRTLNGHEKSALVARFSLDGKYILTGSLDRSIRLWKADSGKLVRVYPGHGGNIYDIEFSPDGKFFASASEDRSIRIWKTDDEKSIKTLIGHEGYVMSLAYTPDGRFLVSGSWDNSVKIWEISTGKCIYSYLDHSDKVNAVAVSPDGTMFASASSDKIIMIWDLKCHPVVDYYFSKEVKAELDESPLFKPKEKGEKKEIYAKRLVDSQKFKEEIYRKYYQKYLVMTQSKDGGQ